MYPETFYQYPAKKSHKKLIIIIITVLLLVIAPILFFVLDDNQKQSQLLPDQKIITIVYDDQGFSPEYVKIKKNTKIVWSNQDGINNQVMQIVANASEENSVLDFGNQTSVGLNGTYSYTFDKPVLVNYRNGADPTKNGTIEVVDN